MGMDYWAPSTLISQGLKEGSKYRDSGNNAIIIIQWGGDVESEEWL